MIAISALPLGDDAGTSWVLTEIAGLTDAFAAVAFVLNAQLLAMWSSAKLGLTPDNPFPDGDVNRVVRGVSIHALTN